MGADRAILVQTDDRGEPLGVAKLLAKIVEEEAPELVILGKAAIDDDNNQTGQMLAGLLGWGQGTFASKVEIAGGHAKVTREVDGGLETDDLQLAAIFHTDLRHNEQTHHAPHNIAQAQPHAPAAHTPAATAPPSHT